MNRLSNTSTYFLRSVVPFFMICLCLLCPILAILIKEYLLMFAGVAFIGMFVLSGRIFWFLRLVEISASEEDQEFEVKTRKKTYRIAFRELKKVRVRSGGYFVILTFTDRKFIFTPASNGYLFYDFSDAISYVQSKVNQGA